MTKGTLFLILSNDKVLTAGGFNGDMYGSPKDDVNLQKNGHYKEVVERLGRVGNENNFIKEAKEFNKKNFGYEDNIIGERELSKIVNEKGEIEFEKGSYFADFKFFSDYLYFKNLSKVDIKFFCNMKGDYRSTYITLPYGKIATFHYGDFIEII